MGIKWEKKNVFGSCRGLFVNVYDPLSSFIDLISYCVSILDNTY